MPSASRFRNTYAPTGNIHALGSSLNLDLVMKCSHKPHKTHLKLGNL